MTHKTPSRPAKLSARIGHVHLKVADLERSLGFYRDLRDPDGNGVELYRDRLQEEWPRNPKGGLAMFTRRLDVDDLLRSRERVQDRILRVRTKQFCGHI